MSNARPKFSICIPAYNRSRHLAPLLESILSQDFSDFEIVICEDKSLERPLIAKIVEEYSQSYLEKIKYYENEINLGYDGNIRNLVAHAKGNYCFFMGNDDLMCPGALSETSRLIDKYPGVGMVLKSYAWFDSNPAEVNQEVRYFSGEQYLQRGKEAITVCYRRSGVISGYIIHRDEAFEAATSAFDGTLYYQMHLTASVLRQKDAVTTPKILVLCRNTEPPQFGNSVKEKGVYTPGQYTPQARLSMVGGIIEIISVSDRKAGLMLRDEILRDYANYFYPYVKDQLNLPVRDYIKLCRGYASMGFSRFPMFYLYCTVAYFLGEKKFDTITRFIRRLLGRSPHFGLSSKP